MKSTLKRFLSLVLCMFMVMVLLPNVTMTAFAATSGTVTGLTDENIGLSFEGDADDAWSANGTSIIGAATSTGGTCSDTQHSSTLTITNKKSTTATLSFDYTIEQNCFVAHKEMDAERKDLGWGNDLVRPYTCSASDQEVQKQLNDLDVLIAGSFPERQTKEYGKKAKLFFRYSERPLKAGNPVLKYIPRFLKWHYYNPPWRKTYMLCASAYTAGDYAKFGLFHNRCYKWGYFPETIRYPSIDDLIDRKAKATILWCGRFLDWKHPDDVIEVAKRLHEAGCCFKIEMIGTGEMERQLKQQASEAGLLDENVRFLGAMSPEAVRRHMESAGIYLFTSDRQEGWGAVLNEAMNSGCAVVASDAAGATPYLVNDGVNGSVYHSGNIQELYEKVRRLLENTTMQYSFGKAAYLTITELWNAEVAAKRFLQLSQALLNGTDASGLFANGPCSLAKPLREDWYQR